MFGLGVFVKAVLTILTPVIVKIDFYLFVAVRIIEGIFEGLTIPCMPDVWRFWAPPMERSRMAAFAMSGNFVGTLVTFPISGILAEQVGWESVFYFFGSLALVWTVLWTLSVTRTPHQDRRISVTEKTYIRRSLQNDGIVEGIKYNDVPWKSIWTSKAVWAIIVADFCEAWGFVILLTQLPMFINGLLNF